MPKAILVSDISGLDGLGGAKRVCRRYKKGKAGKLRCAEWGPRRCYKTEYGRKCPTAPISMRSKTGRRLKSSGHVAGACRTSKGRFKACR